MRKVLAFILSFLALFFLAIPVRAQQFRDDYNVIYTVNQNGKQIDTNVDFTVKVTNLVADVVVKKFSLLFPKSFAISNLKASDDSGAVEPRLNGDQENTQIELEFENPKSGSGMINTFHLNFEQANLFKVNGNVWEVILPTIQGQRSGDYRVEIHLPKDSTRKISIAKPKPDLIQNNTIYWNNPQTKTVYAVFGETQLYDLSLTYNLHNPKLYKVYTEIALPPDMLHQKIYINSLEPAPSMTYSDEDGNFIARYDLNPKESRVIHFKGVAELFVAARPDLQILQRRQIDKQSNHLLTQNDYWKVDQIERYDSLKNPAEIFSYISDNFSYDYQRVTGKIQRLGAQIALQSPNKALCLEFSDSFVALAREKGIFSREIEGYGFSSDPQLRPLSLLTDVLHSWPEYYDQQRQEWISVDPTWQNTSGIDYFNSFDLNHISFAIHGKKADSPLAAGMYKIDDTRDVNVRAIATVPVEKVQLVVDSVDVKRTIDGESTNQGEIVIKNGGNVFKYETPVVLQVKNIEVSPGNFQIDSIAPFEEKRISFSYKASPNAVSENGYLKIYIDSFDAYSQRIDIQPYYLRLIIKIAIFTLILSTIIIAIKVHKKGRYKHNDQETKEDL